MTRIHRTAAALVALPAIAAAGGAGSAGAARPPDRIGIEATLASFDFVDVNAAGIAPGDFFRQTDALIVNDRSAGSDRLRCPASGDEEHPGICDGVLALEEGILTVAGRLPTFEPVDGLTFVWAVTGGSGAYAGATGEVAVVEPATGYQATVERER